MVAVDAAADPAVLDDAGQLVDPGNASHLVPTGDAAGKDAAGDGSAVDTGDSADLTAAAAGGHIPLDLQVPDQGGFRQVPEKALGGAVAAEAQAGDGVAVALEGAAENGDPLEFHIRQIQVRLQGHHQIPAVAVQTAFFREGQEPLHRGDTQTGDFGLLLLSCRGEGRAQQQTQAQQRGDDSVTHGPSLLSRAPDPVSAVPETAPPGWVGRRWTPWR